jgi:hypothetical protein
VIVFLGDAKPGLQALEVVVAVGESRGIDRSFVATVDSVGGAAEQIRERHRASCGPDVLASAKVEWVNLIASIG